MIRNISPTFTGYITNKADGTVLKTTPKQDQEIFERLESTLDKYIKKLDPKKIRYFEESDSFTLTTSGNSEVLVVEGCSVFDIEGKETYYCPSKFGTPKNIIQKLKIIKDNYFRKLTE